MNIIIKSIRKSGFHLKTGFSMDICYPVFVGNDNNRVRILVFIFVILINNQIFYGLERMVYLLRLMDFGMKEIPSNCFLLESF